MPLNTDVQLLEPGDAVRLYEIDATHLGGDVMRFHGHLQEGAIIWQGLVYEPMSIEAKGLDLAIAERRAEAAANQPGTGAPLVGSPEGSV